MRTPLFSVMALCMLFASTASAYAYGGYYPSHAYASPAYSYGYSSKTYSTYACYGCDSRGGYYYRPSYYAAPSYDSPTFLTMYSQTNLPRSYERAIRKCFGYWCDGSPDYVSYHQYGTQPSYTYTYSYRFG